MKEERKKQLEELYAAKVQAKAEEISKWIYEHPEDGDQEFLSSAYICEQLKETGFSVQLPYGSLKTAFRCELKGSKPGATYAFLAEYDALPGYGEQHDELAHACGHNWIGAVCAGVGLMFAQMQEELYLMVDCGGYVCDVIVEHEIYGQITVDLILENRCDVQDFLDKISKSTARPLSILTNGKHYHTVEADREEIIDRIEQKLRLLGYLQETI